MTSRPNTRPTDSVVDSFRRATPRSRALWERACEVFPQGVSGQAKYFSPYPIFVQRAAGAHIVDVDGRSYIDLLMGAGPLLLGHSHPRVIDAVRHQVAEMVNPMMPHENAVAYAERLRGHMPYLERLRFANTGSEAVRSAVRVARAFTGRVKIAKFEGNFHGSDDFALVSTHSHQLRGPDEEPEPVLDYSGISPRLVEEVLVLPYNDLEPTVELIQEHGRELAAVIMEPVAFSSGGGIPADRDFAAAVREVTAGLGIPLIFDEVLCALRLGLAGAPGYLGVRPDLAAIGKAVGGGLPLAAFGGRADLMEAALGEGASSRRIFQSGTFTENPLSIAAGMATLDVLESEPALERANAAGGMLRAGLASLFDKYGLVATVTGVGSIIQVHLGTGEVRNRRDVVRSDVDATRMLLLDLVSNGVLWPPIHPAVTSAAHTSDDIMQVLEVVEGLLKLGRHHPHSVRIANRGQHV